MNKWVLMVVVVVVVVALMDLQLADAKPKPGKDKSDESDESTESADSPESVTSGDSVESSDSVTSAPDDEGNDDPVLANDEGNDDTVLANDDGDSGMSRTIKKKGKDAIDGRRRPSRPKPLRCRSGCSLVNVTSGEEVETTECPEDSTCTSGPYNTTIDGELFEVSYCHYELPDFLVTSLGELEKQLDIHIIVLARASCSATNGTLSWDRDCCDGYSCASEEVEYEYAGSTFTFQFCAKDEASGDASLLETMGCRRRCRRPHKG